MNIFEDANKKKSSEHPKHREDLTRTYKSKTPVPNSLNKQKFKRNQKRVIQKSNSPKKDYQKTFKHNSNDFKDYSSELVKRTKNKGSKSVELFNNNQDPKKCPAIKSILNNSNFTKCKVVKRPEKVDLNGKYFKAFKYCEKFRKKSQSPDPKNKEQKSQKNYLNIQKLLNNYNKRKKPVKPNLKKKHFIEEAFKNIESVPINSKYPQNSKPNVIIQLESEIDDSQDLEQQNIKIDSWLAKNQSRLSESLEGFSDINRVNIVDESEVVAKNFSFINTENLKSDLNPGIFEKKLNKSFEFNSDQGEFILYEADFDTHSVLRTQNPENGVPKLLVQKLEGLDIQPKKQDFSMFCTNFKGPIKKCPNFTLSSQSQVNIPPQASSNFITPEKFPIFSNSLKPKPQISQTWHCCVQSSQGFNTQILLEQVSEELTNNINSLFIIEQLRNLEILANTVNGSHTSEDSQLKIKEYIENKYFTIINFLQPGIEYRISQFLSILNQSETSDFLQKSQKKKEIIKELLADLPPPHIILPNFSKPSESSSESSCEQLEELDIPKYSSFKNSFTFTYQQSAETEPLSPPLISFELKPIECEPENQLGLSNQVLLNYVKNILQSINPYSLIASLENPLKRNALQELDKIQDLQIGTFTDLEIRTFEKLFDYKKALEIDLSNLNEYKDQELIKAENSFKNMVLDCLNYILQQFRPFGYKGEPFIWQRVKKFDGKVQGFEEIYEKVLKDLQEMSFHCIGKWDEGFAESNEKAVRAKVTEMQINKALEDEIGKEEFRWVDYEFEETQVKIDLADVVLYELVTELNLLYKNLGLLLYNKLSDTQQNIPPLNLKSKKRSLLLDYLASKEKPLLNSEDFKQILNSTPTNLHPDKLTPSLFSFENVSDESMSQLLYTNKRAFAKSFKSNRKTGSLNATPISLNKPQNLTLLKNPLSDFNLIEFELKPNNFTGSPEKCKEKKNWNSGLFEKIKFQDSESPSKCVRPLALNDKIGFKAKFEKKNSELIKMKQGRKNSESKNFALENLKGFHLAAIKTPKINIKKSAELSANSLNSPSKVTVKPNFDLRSFKNHRNTRSFRQEKDPGNLRNFINGLVEKNFGIKQKIIPTCSLERKVKPPAEKSSEIVGKSEDEFQFLSTGYLKYHNNLNTKLKISKILVSQHKQERRQTLLFFPPTKKSPNDS